MMKKLINSTILTAAIMILTFASFANAQDSKAVQKAKAAVENASPDDWQTYAKSAQVLIRKKESMKDASEWIDKSLAIKETPYNLEIKGDYYRANNLPKKALEFYVKAMQMGKESDVNFNTSSLQEKVVEIQQAS